MDIPPKSERLSEFFESLNGAAWSPQDAVSANAFLRQHFDAVEEAELDKKYHKDYTRRMLIPSFDIEGAWLYDSGVHRWQATRHTVEIHDNGSVWIKNHEGKILFERPEL
jgi:hypothetical protein